MVEITTVASFADKLDGTDVVFALSVVIGFEYFPAGGENLFHGVEVGFDLVIGEGAVRGANGDIDGVVLVGIDDGGRFAGVFGFNFGVAERVEVGRDFDTETVVVEGDVLSFDFVTFTIFDDERRITFVVHAIDDHDDYDGN